MSENNTANPAHVVIRMTPKPTLYTRDDFVRDLREWFEDEGFEGGTERREGKA